MGLGCSSDHGVTPGGCPAGEEGCSGRCVDVLDDEANCGACGVVCGAGMRCSGGKCALSCQQGLTDCGGVCTDTRKDNAHCGACGAPCGEGEVCDGSGKCTLTCQPELANCGGVCTDLRATKAHCGACDSPCGQGEQCNGEGKCTAHCQQGFIDCGGTCVDPNTSDTFCGATGDCKGDNAGVACAAGHKCDGAGKCVLSCQAGLIDCDGTCIDPNTSDAFCGASGDCQGANAGATCAPGYECDGAGKCALCCPSDFVECDGKCVDPSTSPTYCGADAACTSFATCTATQACVNGACKDLEPVPSAGCSKNTKRWLTRPTTSTSITTYVRSWGVAVGPSEEISVVGDLAGRATFHGGAPQEFTLTGGQLGNAMIVRLAGDGTVLWGSTAQGESKAIDVVALADGSIVVAGYFQGSITFHAGAPDAVTLTAVGGSLDYDIFLVKLDPAGAVVWAKSAGGPSSDFPARIDARDDGSCALVGYFGSRLSSTMTLGAGEPGQIQLTSDSQWEQGFVARYRANGELDWAVAVGGPSRDDRVHGVRWLSDGSLAATGQYTQQVSVGGMNGSGTTLTGDATNTRMFVLRYLASGELAWARQPEGFSLGRDVFEAPDGTIGVYTGADLGVVFGAGEPAQAATAVSGWQLARYEPLGSFVSLLRVAQANEPQDMVITPDGSMVHVGFFSNNATFPGPGGMDVRLSSAGAADVFVACADLAGQTYWTRQGAGNQDNRAQAIALAPNGDVVVAGTFDDMMTFEPGSADQQVLTDAGYKNMFVARFAP